MSTFRLVALLLTLVSAPGFAGPSGSPGEVGQWLDKMARAVRGLNYDGTFVYSHAGELTAMRIVHKVDVDGERERLYSLNGAAREVIRDRRSVTCILPDSRSVVVDKSRPVRSFPSSFPATFENLEAYYQFLLGGQDRIAGRNAQLVLVKPRDEFRYGYRLGLDVDTGLLLKADQIAPHGVPVEQVMFTDIRVHEDIDDSLLKPATSGSEYTWHREREDNALQLPGNSEWVVDRLPDGFAMADQSRHWLPAGRSPVTHMVYTDGLAWVSVFIDRVEGSQDVLQGVSHMGAVHAFGRLSGSHHVTVVGEVPEATVRLIGDSVRFRGSDGGRSQ